MPRVRLLLGALAITVLWFFAVAGSSRFSGPVLFEISDHHGVHRDDLLVTGIWLGCLWMLVRRPASPR